MRMLIVGGAGFLGSHLVDALLARGDEVIVLDSLLTGRRHNLPEEEPHRFHFQEGSLTDFPLDRFFPAPDFIFHLATPASPEAYWKYPRETMMVNSIGTFRLIDFAFSCKAPILYTSSSEVYGNAQLVPQPESYWGNVNPIGVRSMYDEGKRFSEAAIATAINKGLKARIVRLFNSYGPRMSPHDGRAVPTFIRQALKHEPLSIHGDGLQTRSFCYVDDTIAGILAAASYTGENLVFNIGNPKEVTIRALAEMIARFSDNRATLSFGMGRQEEIARRVPDITRAKELLGWQPKVSLASGLKKTIKWYKENL